MLRLMNEVEMTKILKFNQKLIGGLCFSVAILLVCLYKYNTKVELDMRLEKHSSDTLAENGGGVTGLPERNQGLNTTHVYGPGAASGATHGEGTPRPGGGETVVKQQPSGDTPAVSHQSSGDSALSEKLSKQLETLKQLFGPANNDTDLKDLYGWRGLGPEQGLYNFTVVTAMMDIGRGAWPNQSRPYKTYLLYMLRLLMMDINLVLFVDPPAVTFVEWMRQGREKRTHIFVMGFKELPYYKYRDRIAEIMNSTEYKKDNELVRDKLCESYIPEYDILQLAKIYFLDRTVRENPFKTSYFIWMDGGYGHGVNVFPADHLWIPKGLFEHSDKLTFVERTPGVKHFEAKKDKIHKLSINVLPGGFCGGGSEVIKEIYKRQQEQMEEWMRQGVVDDDQTMNMLIFYKYPSMFNIVKGDWFEAFKLFHSPKQT
ncbi:protein HtrL-like [Physella acuta]|uniref:protein HtrL-like n=1 Tax=Physella acuta TaxID=109671 RepID=UPI0027DEA8B4|nr:protein HtrL-like [Physella acuta]